MRPDPRRSSLWGTTLIVPLVFFLGVWVFARPLSAQELADKVPQEPEVQQGEPQQAEPAPSQPSNEGQAPAPEKPVLPGQVELPDPEEQARQAQEAEARAKAIAAHEEARLNKLQAAQASLEDQLSHQQGRSDALRDQVTALVQKVGQELETALSPGMATELEQRVSGLLAQVREDLEFQLTARRHGQVPRIEVHELPKLRVDEDRLQALRLNIVKTSDTLEERATQLRWEQILARSGDLRALNKVRLSLLSNMTDGHREKLTGFSASGWDNVRRELDQMRLELTVRWLRFRERLTRLGQEVMRRKSEVLALFGKLAVLIMVFRWWRARADDVLLSMRRTLLERREEFPALEHARVFFWYLIKIRSPLEWLLLGWIIARFWIPTSWLELSLLWTMYKWLVGASVVVAWLNAFATRGIRRRDRARDGNKKLRLQTLGLLGFSAMGVGLALEMAQLLVGQGAIFHWIRKGAWWLSVPVAIYLLVRWKPVVLLRCEQRSHQSALARWVHTSRGGIRGILGLVVGAVYLMLRGTMERGGTLLMQLELFRRASAFLYRRDAEQKAEADEQPIAREPASCVSAPQFDPDRVSASLLEIGPDTHISKMAAWLDEGRHSLIAVVGERGAGKTSFLTRLAQDKEQAIFNQVIDCPKSGLADLYAVLERELGSKIADQDAFAERLEDPQIQVICVDNLHRLVRSSIGGLAALDEFIGFARRWNKHVTWILGFGSSAWRYTQRARGDRAYFDEVVELSPWKEQEIAKLLQDRCAQAEVEPDFSGLRVANNDPDGFSYVYGPEPQSVSQEDIEASRASYYRILWDYSSGNPGVALHAWSQSLFEEEGSSGVVVRLFEQKATTEVEKLSLAALFTLRSLIQMDQATDAELVECTNLLSQDCAGAIRSLLSLGIVERMGPWYRISWEWYRPVMTVLLRQQLLMK